MSNFDYYNFIKKRNKSLNEHGLQRYLMALIKKYKVKIEVIDNHVDDIFTLTFTSNKKFIYRPGQFLHLALDEYDGISQWPDSRCFSIQSNPDEALLKITYIVKGKFTNRMKNELFVGKEIWLKMPYGDFFDRGHSTEKCVFIAGGTGITPFLSLFTYRQFQEYKNPRIYLGFKNIAHNLYNGALSNICNLTHKVFLYYEDNNNIISIEKIFPECGIDSIYFISGPLAMINHIKSELLQYKVSLTNIFIDDWS